MRGHALWIHGRPSCCPAPGPWPHLRNDAATGRIRHFAVTKALDVESSNAQSGSSCGPQGPERGH